MMKRNTLALALVAGMATMAVGPAIAQGQGHGQYGQHGQHMQHGEHGRHAHGTGDAQQTAPATQAESPMMPGCPMMRGMMPMDQMRGHGHAHAHPHPRAGAGARAGHAGHAARADKDMSASSIAFRAVNEAMHHGMDIAMTGDADIDFVRGMIAHHVGAVDMARIVQIFGSDPEIAALAEEIIEAQESEIATMRDWLARNAPDHAE
jgi:uncharacterized protein (DUF305 family)